MDEPMEQSKEITPKQKVTSLELAIQIQQENDLASKNGSQQSLPINYSFEGNENNSRREEKSGSKQNTSSLNTKHSET